MRRDAFEGNYLLGCGCPRESYLLLSFLAKGWNRNRVVQSETEPNAL